MLLKNNINKIKSILSNQNVLTSLEERYCYSTDSSNLNTQNKLPEIVVFAETIEDVQKIIEFANKHSIPVVSRGAGTNMVGGCICNQGGIVLNFSKMNKILDINPVNMTARVQPGVILGDLKNAAESLNLFFPPDPSNYKVSTIGGAIAQSSGGATSFKYGTTKDYILSLKVVTADGKLIQLGLNTIKDACGYHLAQLMVGSEGTLAIIVEAVVKLIPKPETKRAVCAYFNSVDDAISTVNNITSGEIFPAAIDFMDKHSIMTVEEFAHCGLKTNYKCMILIELDGNEASINNQIRKIEKILNKNNVKEYILANSEQESENIWQARRCSFAATTRLAPDVLSDDIIVPRENLGKMIKTCQDIVKKYNLNMCLVGHAADGNLHPQIALDTDNPKEFHNYMRAKQEIYTSAISLGGTISAEHGVGLEKTEYLKDIIEKPSLEYMKRIKQIFDPKNILNPGKIFTL